MSTQAKLSRMVCNSCGHIFNIQEATIKNTNYYGVNIPVKVCPKCGGTFRMIDIPKELDQYLYVDNDDRYYTYKRGK